MVASFVYAAIFDQGVVTSIQEYKACTQLLQHKKPTCNCQLTPCDISHFYRLFFTTAGYGFIGLHVRNAFRQI